MIFTLLIVAIKTEHTIFFYRKKHIIKKVLLTATIGFLLSNIAYTQANMDKYKTFIQIADSLYTAKDYVTSLGEN